MSCRRRISSPLPLLIKDTPDSVVVLGDNFQMHPLQKLHIKLDVEWLLLLWWLRGCCVGCHCVVVVVVDVVWFCVKREHLHAQKREPHMRERSKKKGVCACVFFLCILFVFVVRWECCCWCVAVFVVEFCGVCVFYVQC
jgi:hypothetical protein